MIRTGGIGRGILFSYHYPDCRSIFDHFSRFSFSLILSTSSNGISGQVRHLQTKRKPNRKPRLPVILLQDLPNRGVKGQLIEVKRGYARNYLIPSRIATYATEENKKKYQNYQITSTEGGLSELKTENYHSQYIKRILSVPLLFQRNLSPPLDQATIHRVYQRHSLFNVLEKHIILPDNKPISTYGVHKVTILLDSSDIDTSSSTSTSSSSSSSSPSSPPSVQSKIDVNLILNPKSTNILKTDDDKDTTKKNKEDKDSEKKKKRGKK